MFNYFITIHNSEAHLNFVLDGLFKCSSDLDRVWCILDGCTDGSKEIVKDYGLQYIELKDVRETRAITYALKNLPLSEYNVILQDDVVIQSSMFESDIRKAYEKFPDIGVLGMRHGANFGKDAEELSIVQNEFQPPVGKFENLKSGHITERQLVFKSPICLSKKVVETLGGYDDRFAPIGYDDYEYCIQAYKAGFKNYVYALDIDQPVEWGGTRRNPVSNYRQYEIDHLKLLKELYPKEIETLSTNHPSLEQIKI
jgi:GT2 family glycosyltransferase